MYFAGLRCRVDAQFGAEQGAQPLVDGHRAGRFAQRRLGEHEQPVRLLVVRIGGDRGAGGVPGGRRLGQCQSGPCGAVPGLAQQVGGQLLGGQYPVGVRLLDQDPAVADDLQGALGRDEGECRLGSGGPTSRLVPVRVGDHQVDLDRFAQPVPVPAALDHARAEHAAYPADQGRHVVRRAPRRLVCPQHLDDGVQPDPPAALHGEQFQQGTGLAAAHGTERQRAPALPHREFAHQTEPQRLRLECPGSPESPAHRHAASLGAAKPATPR